jgi:hypothetical protein
MKNLRKKHWFPGNCRNAWEGDAPAEPAKAADYNHLLAQIVYGHLYSYRIVSLPRQFATAVL